jgi:multidrug efflux pump subunit AcrB
MLTSRMLAIPYSSGVNRFWALREFDRRFTGATQSYQDFLALALRYRVAIIAIAFVVLGGGSIWMGGQLPQEILPRINTGQVSLFAQFPPGTTLEQNHKVMAMVDEILLQQPETDSVFTTSGGFIFGNNTSENPICYSQNYLKRKIR